MKKKYFYASEMAADDIRGDGGRPWTMVNAAEISEASWTD